MPTYIERFGGPDAAAVLQDKMEDIQLLLCMGPVLVGESHHYPSARAVIADLIVDGHVKYLFLELPQLLTGLSNDKLLQSIGYAERIKNALPLSELCRLALEHDVEFAGYDTMSHTPSPASAAGMKIRNQAMGVLLAARVHEPKTIALTGAHHFDAKKCDGVSLKDTGLIRDGHVFDLSNYSYIPEDKK